MPILPGFEAINNYNKDKWNPMEAMRMREVSQNEWSSLFQQVHQQQQTLIALFSAPW